MPLLMVLLAWKFQHKGLVPLVFLHKPLPWNTPASKNNLKKIFFNAWFMQSFSDLDLFEKVIYRMCEYSVSWIITWKWTNKMITSKTVLFVTGDGMGDLGCQINNERMKEFSLHYLNNTPCLSFFFINWITLNKKMF